MSSTRATPLVSVIIPTYNRAYCLDRAVQSVLGQTFQDFELIVVDDASTDGTAEYLAGLRSSLSSIDSTSVVQTDPHSQTKIHSITLKKNSGVSAARNRGIEESKGEWIAFLDSDDEWLPSKLEGQIQALNAATPSIKTPSNLRLSKNGSEIRLIHTEEIWVRDNVRVNPPAKYKKSGGRIFKKCVDLCAMAPSSVMIRRDVFADVGLFREDFPVCEDYELWLRICAGEDVLLVEEPLTRKFGGHEDQLSNSVGMDLWRVRALLPFVLPNFYGEWFEPSSMNPQPHVRDLLVGERNSFYDFISEEERTYVLQNIRHRLDVLLKGALKHKNIMLQKSASEIVKLLC